MLNRSAFFRYSLSMATPIMVQNLISTLVNTADTVMLGYTSQAAMAAASLAGQMQLILFMLFFGLSAGISVLGAQYWGRKDTQTIERILALGIKLSAGIALLFLLAAELLPGQIMRLLTNDPDTIREGIVYLRIVGFSWVFAALSQSYVSVQRCMERVVFPTVVYVVSLAVNVLLNAVFIFGLFGSPKLGLRGVALATVTARFMECAICLVHSATVRCGRLRMRCLRGRSGALMQDLLKISIPPILNDASYSLSGVLLAAILGRMGSDTVAANAVAVTGLNLGAVVSRSISNATTIILGKALGEGDTGKARIYAKRMTWLSALFGLAGSGFVVLLRPLILRIYAGKLTDTALTLLSAFLFVEAARIFAEAVNTCWNCGCLRSGGDSKYGFIVDTVTNWCFILPLTALAAFWLKLPAQWVFLCMCLEEYVKLPVYFTRYRSDCWMKNITREQGAGL